MYYLIIWLIYTLKYIPSSVMITFTEVEGERLCKAPRNASIISLASESEIHHPTGCPAHLHAVITPLQYYT